MTITGFRAQNHPQQVARRGELDDVDDRRTPLDLLDECARFAGVDAFDLDVAASSANAKASRYFDRETDGLASPWTGRVWCNPPFSNVRPWVEAAHRWSPACERIVLLLPANRTEQGWWTELVEPFREDVVRTKFLAGRRRFDRPGWVPPAKGDRPPFGLVVLVWGAP